MELAASRAGGGPRRQEGLRLSSTLSSSVLILATIVSDGRSLPLTSTVRISSGCARIDLMSLASRCLVFALAGTAWGAGAGLSARPVQDIDYEGLYAKGMTFAAFLENARAKRDEWRANYNDATVSPDLITRMRALPSKRRLLVVAEDWCSDSANTIPYVARLVDGAPERLELRVINTERGKALMEANRTPDGRTATPVVVILADDGRMVGAWTERPSSTQAWFIEKQKTTMQKPLHEELMTWYAKDAGKTTVAEIADILAR